MSRLTENVLIIVSTQSLLMVLRKSCSLPFRVTVLSFGMLACPVTGICAIIFEVSRVSKIPHDQNPFTFTNLYTFFFSTMVNFLLDLNVKFRLRTEP